MSGASPWLQFVRVGGPNGEARPIEKRGLPSTDARPAREPVRSTIGLRGIYRQFQSDSRARNGSICYTTWKTQCRPGADAHARGGRRSDASRGRRLSGWWSPNPGT